MQIVKRCINSNPLHIGIAYTWEMPSKRFSPIFKIRYKRTMPYTSHGINFTETNRHMTNIFQ